MSIRDCLVRQSIADKVEIGTIVKRAYNGKFGEVLRSLVNGMITENLSMHQANVPGVAPLSSDRILGRCEAYQNIINALELMINEMEELQAPKEDEGGEE